MDPCYPVSQKVTAALNGRSDARLSLANTTQIKLHNHKIRASVFSSPNGSTLATCTSNSILSLPWFRCRNRKTASVPIFPISAKSLFNDHLVTCGPKAKISLSNRSSLGSVIDAGSQTFSCFLELRLLLEPPTRYQRQTLYN